MEFALSVWNHIKKAAACQFNHGYWDFCTELLDKFGIWERLIYSICHTKINTLLLASEPLAIQLKNNWKSDGYEKQLSHFNRG